MSLPEKNYTAHKEKAMLTTKYKVVYSCVSSLKEGETVYRVREKGDSVLIGHTFHKSLPFNPYSLECWGNSKEKLLAKVEPIK